MNDELQDLFTVLYAGLRYLQEDFTVLRFGSQYGQHTQMIYKDLTKNTSSYPIGALDRLESAMRFAAIPPEASVMQPRRGGYWSGGPTGPSNRGGGFQFRNRGRSRPYSYNQNYGNENQGNAFAPRSVPFDRQQSQSSD